MVNRLLMLLVVLSAAGSLLGAASSPNRYIVQLAPTAQSAEIEKAAGAAKKTFGGAVGHRYRRAIQGFSITLPQCPNGNPVQTARRHSRRAGH